MRPLSRLRPSLIVLPVLISAALAAPAQAAVQTGRNLELNHSRELALLEGQPGSGWIAGTSVRVEVFRGTTLIASKEGAFEAVPKGNNVIHVFEINHAGPGATDRGDCWEGISGERTPDVKPGDKVVATVLDATGAATADVDYLFVRNIAFEEDRATGAIRGHAQGRETAGAFDLGTPVDLAAEIMEAKRVGATVDGEHPFAATDLDPAGNFTNIVVSGTPGAGELFIDHLEQSGGGTGTTVAHRTSDLPDLQADFLCGSLATTALSSVSHSVINLANVGTDMTVGGPRLHPTTVTAVTLGGRPAAVIDNSNADTWSATIGTADLQALGQGDHQLVVEFSDGALPDTRTILKDTVTPVLSAERVGNAVALSSDGGEVVRYTTDGSAPNSQSRVYDGVRIPLAVGDNTIRALAIDAAGNPGQGSFQFHVAAPAQTGTAGTAAADTAAAGTAAAGTPAAGTAAAGGAGPATGGSGTPNAGALTKLSLKSLSTPARIKRSKVRRSGITVTMGLPAGTKIVKVAVYRKLAGGKKVFITKKFRSTSKTGLYRVGLGDARLRRMLRVGNYEVVVTPKSSPTNTGTSSRAAFKVVSG